MRHEPADAAEDQAVFLPQAPLCHATRRFALWISEDGESEDLTHEEAAARLGRTPAILCNAPMVGRLFDAEIARAYDVLELFAFARAARFARPTPAGLAAALGLPAPKDRFEEAAALLRCAARLLADLKSLPRRQAADVATLAGTLTRAGWLWGPVVGRNLGPPAAGERASLGGLDVWRHLPRWSDAQQGEPFEGAAALDTDEVERRVRSLTEGAEYRPEQIAFARAVAGVFATRPASEPARVLLAEAGTGVGKTLGYLAPAHLWSRTVRRPVWVSTYTRNLQQQAETEAAKLVPNEETRRRQVAVVKGRENYLCLLRYEEAVRTIDLAPQDTIALGLAARWITATRNGDAASGDLPSWLAEIVGAARLQSLLDRRGECIGTSCRHHRTCFPERALRNAAGARIVIANHALLFARAAAGSPLPSHIVLDEAHHLFDAADNAFSAHLTAREAALLGRWIRGGQRRGLSGGERGGLRARFEDLLEGDEDLTGAVRDVTAAASFLVPSSRQVADGPSLNALDRFLTEVAEHVETAVPEASLYEKQILLVDAPQRLVDAAGNLKAVLARLSNAFAALLQAIARLDEGEDDETDRRESARVAGLRRSIERRGEQTLQSWIEMMDAVRSGTPEGLIDVLTLRHGPQGRAIAGMHRHHVDPTQVLARAILSEVDGAVLTSATLRDASDTDDWRAAEIRTGTQYLAFPAIRSSVASPFDYASQTRIVAIEDVSRSGDDVAAAMLRLFEAAGGGALGLFTSIARLRQVHGRIERPLSDAGIALLAQHVDGIDTGSLIEMFRADESSCLLGTDATRDGIDVPGRSLRLIVYERVPWPRPDALHRVRREHLGGRQYDDMLTRLRLKQAFGRLIRRKTDKGVFVLLDRRFPSRLERAFPPDAAVIRCPLNEAVETVRTFLGA